MIVGGASHLRLWASLVLATAVTLASVPTRAERVGSRAVVLQHDPNANARVIRRVVAELDAMGLRVTTTTATNPRPDVGKKAGEPTLVVLEPGLHAVTLQQNGEVQRLELPPLAPDASEDVLALALVERLRSPLELVLREAVPPTAPTQREASPPPAAPTPAETATPSVAPSTVNEPKPSLAPGSHSPETTYQPWLEPGVAAGIAVSPGGVPPALVLSARLRAQLFRPLGVEVFGLSMMQSSTLSAAEGSAGVRFAMAGGTFDLRAPIAGRLHVSPGVGAAAVYFRVAGQATDPFESRAEQTWLVAPVAKFDGGYAVGAGFMLNWELRTAVPFPEPVIAFAGRVRATWGVPIVMAGLGVSRVF